MLVSLLFKLWLSSTSPYLNIIENIVNNAVIGYANAAAVSTF